MAISFAQQRKWQCSNCGSSIDVLTWLAVDMVERPDLRPVLAGGAWARIGCATCGAIVERDEPLLVTRLASAAPVIMAVPHALADAGEPPRTSVR